MKKLAALSWSFIWISTVTLGGGMAMIPFMEREFVERRGWLTANEMTDIIAITNSLPGLIAANMAVLVGYRVMGILGAIVAAFSVCLTPFIAIVLLAKLALLLTASTVAGHVFLGIRAGTAALVAASLVGIAQRALKGAVAWVLAIAAFVIMVVCQ